MESRAARLRITQCRLLPLQEKPDLYLSCVEYSQSVVLWIDRQAGPQSPGNAHCLLTLSSSLFSPGHFCF